MKVKPLEASLKASDRPARLLSKRAISPGHLPIDRMETLELGSTQKKMIGVEPILVGFNNQIEK